MSIQRKHSRRRRPRSAAPPAEVGECTAKEGAAGVQEGDVNLTEKIGAAVAALRNGDGQKVTSEALSQLDAALGQADMFLQSGAAEEPYLTAVTDTRRIMADLRKAHVQELELLAQIRDAEDEKARLMSEQGVAYERRDKEETELALSNASLPAEPSSTERAIEQLGREVRFCTAKIRGLELKLPGIRAQYGPLTEALLRRRLQFSADLIAAYMGEYERAAETLVDVICRSIAIGIVLGGDLKSVWNRLLANQIIEIREGGPLLRGECIFQETRAGRVVEVAKQDPHLCEVSRQARLAFETPLAIATLFGSNPGSES